MAGNRRTTGEDGHASALLGLSWAAPSVGALILDNRTLLVGKRVLDSRFRSGLVALPRRASVRHVLAAADIDLSPCCDRLMHWPTIASEQHQRGLDQHAIVWTYPSRDSFMKDL